jgi:hypothetical protein
MNKHRERAAHGCSGRHDSHHNASRKGSRITRTHPGGPCRRLEALLTIDDVEGFHSGMAMNQRIQSRRLGTVAVLSGSRRRQRSKPALKQVAPCLTRRIR